jgi:hypothetical protein
MINKGRLKKILVEVKIYYFKVFGKGSISLNLDVGATVSDAFNQLNEKYGEAFEKEFGKTFLGTLGSIFNVFLNGKYLDLSLGLKKN